MLSIRNPFLINRHTWIKSTGMQKDVPTKQDKAGVAMLVPDQLVLQTNNVILRRAMCP
jgi:hypothetical protein